MAVATLTSKGQVTIPREVRERLKLHTGDRIDFRVEADGTVRIVPLARKVEDVFGMLADKAKHAYSIGQARTKIREAFRKGRL